MSRQYDSLTTIKLSRENTVALRECKAQLIVPFSMNALVNYVLANYGIPALKNGPLAMKSVKK